jgi:hypothetical protein
MISKIKKKVSSPARKPMRVAQKKKQINWDKYFGKITFPFDPMKYQQEARNEWGN